jgi:hypothetical protein
MGILLDASTVREFLEGFVTLKASAGSFDFASRFANESQYFAQDDSNRG